MDGSVKEIASSRPEGETSFRALAGWVFASGVSDGLAARLLCLHDERQCLSIKASINTCKNIFKKTSTKRGNIDAERSSF
jgi:hypothetical protein